MDTEYIPKRMSPVMNWLAKQRAHEAKIPLLPRVRAGLLFQTSIAFYGRVEPNLMLESGEVDEDAVRLESRHPMTDDFNGCGAPAFAAARTCRRMA